jgi:hypothetical protein
MVASSRLLHLDSGSCSSIQVQNIECEARVLSDWEWNIQRIDFSYYLDLIVLILKGTAQNGNGKKIPIVAPSKKPRIIWSYQL